MQLRIELVYAIVLKINQLHDIFMLVYYPLYNLNEVGMQQILEMFLIRCSDFLKASLAM